MIRVRLNDNIAVDVNTNDPQAAAAAGRRWFQQNHPQEFEAWRQTQLGIGSSFTRGLSAGVDQFQGALYSAAEGLGRAVGSPGLERFGQEGRVEQERQAEAAFPSELRQPFTEVTGAGGATRAVTEAVAGSLPSTATGLGGALLGAKLGAPLGPAGAIVGGLAGGAAAAFPLLFGSNIQRQIQEQGDITSPGAAAAAAAVQAPLESAVDVATLGAGRFLRRPAAEAAQAAGAGLGRRVATGAAVGTLEAPVEVAQTAIERAQAGLPVFTTEGGAGREYLEAGLGGLAAGTVTGGVLRGAFGERPAPAETPTVPQDAFGGAPPTPAPEAAAPPRMAPLTVPERPEAFTTVEEAQSFLAENPQFTPPTPLATPEATIGFVNAARLSNWEQSVQQTRQQAISEFFPRTPETTQIAPSEAITNLAEAANRGDLNLNDFSPNDVAKAALASRDIDPARVTKAEVKAATDQLNALADAGVLRKESPTKYAVNFGARPEAQPAPAPTAAPEAAAAPEVIPPAAEGAPVPEAAPTPPAPQFAPDPLRNNRPANLRDTDGWKLHIGTDGLSPQQIQRLIQEVRNTGARGKLGRSGGQVGKDVTIYAGSRADAERIARQLSPFTSGRIYGDTAVDDVELAPGVGARFDVAGDRDFHQYGRGGIPILRDLIEIGKPFSDEAIQRSEATLAQRYGEFFTGRPAQPTARTTVEVDGVRRETTPETLQQTVDEIRTGQPAAPASPQEEQLARAAAELDPGSGAGETTRTAEEALLNTPKDMPLKDQRKILDKQYQDVFDVPPEGFRGGRLRKWLSSTLTGLGRQPIYQTIANVGRRIVDRKYQAATDFAVMHEPLRALPAESQTRVMLTLQQASARRQSWNRDAFTAEENRAMDGVVQMGQRGLDYMIDAYTTKFFNPINATSPQQRARLEAFQQAKGRRLITDFSDAELRALSEEGAREVRSYNTRRNPFYLPQVANGTHFVAAYKRLPGGKKGELVRIYFYNPLTGIQKLRQRAGAQRDFEALSIQALRDEFPDSNKFLIMPRGIEATREDNAQKLKRDGEFIARYLDELKRVSGPEAQRLLARMSREIDKAQMDRFFKKNEDKLRAVTPWNAVDYARETLPNYYLALANIQARVAAQDDFVRAQADFSQEEKDYWDKWLNFNSTPIEALGAGRALAGAWFLGGNLSTAMIQLTQNPVLLPARFARDGAGGLGTRKYGSAARDVYGAAGGLKGLGKELEYSKYLANSKKLPADEVAALKQAIEEGVVRPSTIINMRGQFDADDFRRLGIADQTAAKFSSGANTTVDLLFRFLNAADETNRTIAFLAALRVAKADPGVLSRAGRLDNRTYANPYEYAKEVTEQTNFMGGPEDQNLLSRFHPVAQVMTQFLTPSFKFLELFGRSAVQTIEGLRKSDPTMAKAGAIMFATMMAAQVTLAGLWSLPFADRLKELIEFVLSKAFDTEMDFEQELEKLLGTSLLAASLNYGLPHASNVATLSERLKIDVLPQGSISEWDVFSLLGPVGGLIEKPLLALDAYDKNDYWGVAYALLPTAAANIVKGAQIGIMGEQWTRAGGRIIAPEQVERISQEAFVPPALRQAIGFAPPEFADIRRGVRRAQEMREPLQRDTERANRELSLIVLRMYEAQLEGRTADARARAQEYLAREREIIAEQANKPEEFRVRINRRAIEDRARQDLLGRGSLEVLLRRAPVAQRPEIQRMFERTLGTQPAD